MAKSYLAIILSLLLACELLTVMGAREPDKSAQSADIDRKKKKKHPYTSPAGFFIQERASKQLPGPGQHFRFGALKPWEDILSMVDQNEDRKLLLLIRHGQAISNYLGDTLGPDEWFAVEGTCQYDDGKGTIWNIFDADLTGLGQDQAKALNSMLVGGEWYNRVTGGKPVRAIISPLTRCLHTASLVLDGIKPNATNVEEFVRETLGEDTCDARRSVSDPNSLTESKPQSPCSFDKGLASSYPKYKYRVYNPEDDADRSFGLLGDSDHLWTKDSRERQKHQVKRAKKFLDILFENAPEQVVVVITHSGFTRSLLLAVQREPYRPQNAEMVPVIVEKVRRKVDTAAESTDDEDDSWVDAVIDQMQSDNEAGVLENSNGDRVGVRKQTPSTKHGHCLRRMASSLMQKLNHYQTVATQ